MIRHLSVVILAALALAACGDDGRLDPLSAPTIAPSTTVVATTSVPDDGEPPATSVPPTTDPDAAPPPTTVPPPTTTLPAAFDRAAARAELAAARERWAASAPFAYRLRYAPVCFCPRQELEVLVLDQVRIASSTAEYPWGHVYDWFGEIELAIETAYLVEVSYDERGVPTSLWIDEDPMMADEEHGMELLELTPVDEVLAELFTDDYPCGEGFWAATPTQQAALLIPLRTGDAEVTAGTDDLATVENAELRLGHDLMANWCDDVIEPGEPEPDVTASWAIVGGTITVEIDDAAGTATAELRRVVARRSDGTEVLLGDATITNDAWAVYAG